MSLLASISSGPRSTTRARIFIGAFFGIFLVFGAIAWTQFFGRPALRMIEARDWPATTCEILGSRVAESDADDGTVYRVDVSYRYDVDGRTYANDRYKFVPGSSSGYSGKAEIVRQLSPGTRTTCYVNPSDPTDSVIERGPTADMWFAVIPLIFTFVGAVGVIGACVGSGPLTSQLMRLPPTRTHVAFEPAMRSNEPEALRPIQSRATKVIGLTVVAVIWNGLLAVFLAKLFGSWKAGSFMWLLGIFLVPFCLVGIGVVIGVVHQTLAYFNPWPSITVSSAVVPLGDDVRVSWAVDGRADRLRGLSIVLEGREEVTVRSGDDTKTRKHVFASLPVVAQAAPVSFQGSKRVTIPERSMHSFDAPNNKIVWAVRVRGDMANWPDSDDEFPFTVAPRGR